MNLLSTLGQVLFELLENAFLEAAIKEVWLPWEHHAEDAMFRWQYSTVPAQIVLQKS